MLAIGLMAVLMMVAGAVAAAVSLSFDQHRAAAAADLAALSAASTSERGGDVCGTAERVAAANRAELTRCRLSGPIVEVEVVVRSPVIWQHSWDLRGRAVAGPAGLTPSTSPATLTSGRPRPAQ